jgi:hypothetical protein
VIRDGGGSSSSNNQPSPNKGTKTPGDKIPLIRPSPPSNPEDKEAEKKYQEELRKYREALKKNGIVETPSGV